MHESVMAYVAAQVGALALEDLDTLEVGSYDVNGSVRSFFNGHYVGVDHADGPGVDEVMDACALVFEAEAFEVVVSTEMLEHCLRPWQAISEMARVLRTGGHLLVTCRGYDHRGCFPVHNEPDIYRFSAEGLEALAVDAGLTVFAIVADPQVPGFFMCAVKR